MEFCNETLARAESVIGRRLAVRQHCPDGGDVEPLLVEDELAAVRDAGDMEALASALRDLVAISGNDVHKCLSHSAVPGDEQIDILIR